MEPEMAKPPRRGILFQFRHNIRLVGTGLSGPHHVNIEETNDV